MRIKPNRLQTCHHRTAQNKKDGEGNSYVEYGPPHSFEAEVWPAGGRIQAEMYGQRLPYIQNCKVDGDYYLKTSMDGRIGYCLDGAVICENDGICLDVCARSDPDYRVLSIRPYRHLVMELEMIR